MKVFFPRVTDVSDGSTQGISKFVGHNEEEDDVALLRFSQMLFFQTVERQENGMGKFCLLHFIFILWAQYSNGSIYLICNI